MTEMEINNLIDKYQTNRCSPREIRMIEGFLDSYQKDENHWNEKNHGDKKELEQRLFAKIDKNIRPTTIRQNQINLVWWYRVAASLIIIVALSYGIFRMLDTTPVLEKIQIVTKEIPRGQKSMVHLSDGTTIYINSETKLSYPERFSGKFREIELDGEAFFDVEPNPDMPFIVRTGDIETRVLGTSFNINTHFDKIKVTVASGVVRIQNKNPNIRYDELAILKPNQQLIFDKSDQSIKVNEVKAGRFLAWKEKRLVFNNEPISQVINRLEKWYDVEITYLNEDIKHCVFTGVFENEPLASVLETLHEVADINFKLQGKKVQLSGTGCLQ